jgi:hypothetical protein
MNAITKKTKPSHPPGLYDLLAGLNVEVVAGLETELEDAEEAVTELVPEEAVTELVLEETAIGITVEEESAVEGVVSVDTTIVLVSTGAAVLSTEVALGIVCVCGWVVARIVVTVTRPPVSGETA